MGLSLCTECETLEGKWREMTKEEMLAERLTPEEAEGLSVCCECGSIDSRRNVPEHDDFIIER